MPKQMHVVLGTRETLAFRPPDFLAYYHTVRGRFMHAVSAREATYPLPVPHAACPATPHNARRSAKPTTPVKALSSAPSTTDTRPSSLETRATMFIS